MGDKSQEVVIVDFTQAEFSGMLTMDLSVFSWTWGSLPTIIKFKTAFVQILMLLNPIQISICQASACFWLGVCWGGDRDDKLAGGSRTRNSKTLHTQSPKKRTRNDPNT